MLWLTLRRARTGGPAARRQAVQQLGSSGSRRAVQQLDANLGDRDWEVRVEAAAAIVRQRGPAATEALKRALDDHACQVRTAAVALLAECGGRGAITLIVPRLGDPASSVRRAAMEALDRLEPSWPESIHASLAVPGLVALLAGSQRTDAIALLGRIRSAEASAPLLALTREADPAAAAAAADALVAVGAPAAETVAADLTNESESVRTSAGRILARIGWQPRDAALAAALAAVNGEFGRAASMGAVAVPALLAALRETDTARADGASAALAAVGPPAVAPLLSLLPAAHPAHAAPIYRTLTDIGAPAVPELLEAFGGRDRTLRVGLARVLGDIGDPRAVPALVMRLTDEKDDVTQAIVEALDRIDPQWHTRNDVRGAIPQLLAQLLHARTSRRRGAMVALAKVVSHHDTPILLEALAEATADNRPLLLSVLRQPGVLAPTDTPGLLQLLADTPPDRREAIAPLLEQPGLLGPEDGPALLKLLADAPAGHRQTIASLLQQPGVLGPQDAPALFKLLADTPAEGRQTVASLLHATGLVHASDLPTLVALLVDCSPDKRQPIAWLLNQLDAGWTTAPLADAAIAALAEAVPFLPEGLAASLFTRIGPRAADALAAFKDCALAQRLLAEWGDLRGIVALATSLAGGAIKWPPPPSELPPLGETLRVAGAALLAGGHANSGGLDAALTSALSPKAALILLAAVADALAGATGPEAVDRLVAGLTAQKLFDRGYVREVLFRLAELGSPVTSEQVAAWLVEGEPTAARPALMRKLRAMPLLDTSMLDLAEEALTYKLEDYGHDRRNQRPTMVEGDRAVSALCERSGPLSTALLGAIARQKDSSIELPCCNVCTNRYRIDFSARRAMASGELKRRGIEPA